MRCVILAQNRQLCGPKSRVQMFSAESQGQCRLRLVAGAPVGYPSRFHPMGTKRFADLPGVTDRRIDALLTLLAENSTIVISGAKIAKEIGVTRQQVWRWIEKLRTVGVKVQGHA